MGIGSVRPSDGGGRVQLGSGDGIEEWGIWNGVSSSPVDIGGVQLAGGSGVQLSSDDGMQPSSSDGVWPAVKELRLCLSFCIRDFAEISFPNWNSNLKP